MQKHKCKIAILSLLTSVVMAPGLRAEVVIGDPAPDFTLKDAQGNEHSLSDYSGQFVVLEWFNDGCPFVRKFYDAGEMQRLQKEYAEKGVVWLAICSSRPGSQGYYEPAEAVALTEKMGVKAAAYLLDSAGDVGRLYGALVTPHMYVINPEGTLIYQGAIDSIRSAQKEDIAKADNYVVNALTAAMSGQPVKVTTSRPYGCGVKY